MIFACTGVTDGNLLKKRSLFRGADTFAIAGLLHFSLEDNID
jgi:hypothetical protein